MDIRSNKEIFLIEITDLKKEITDNLSLISLEVYRDEFKGRLNPERFREYFIEKAIAHHIFKYVIIRLMEESMQKVNPKLNVDGINNWRLLSKNFRNDYLKLYELAILDVKREPDFQSVFEDTVYDGNSINKLVMNSIATYISKLSKYEWSTLDANVTIDLIEVVYPSNKRNELQKNMYGSPLIEFLLVQVGLDE